MIDTGTLEQHIADLRDGGWEALERIIEGDPVEKATARRQREATTEADKRSIRTAWAAFAATPGGRLALQALVDRTLNKSVFLTHLGLSAEQVAIHGAYREGQNFVVLVILNLIRQAHDEPQQQRETP